MWKMGWFLVAKCHSRSPKIAPFDWEHKRFLLAFYNVSILHRFWYIGRKSLILTYCACLWHLAEGLPLKLCRDRWQQQTRVPVDLRIRHSMRDLTFSLRKTVCKDDSGSITRLKHQTLQKLYYLAAHRHVVNVHPDVGCRFLLQGPRLPSLFQSVIALWCCQFILHGEQRLLCQRFAEACRMTAEWPESKPATCISPSQHSNHRPNAPTEWHFKRYMTYETINLVRVHIGWIEHAITVRVSENRANK